MTGLDLSSDGLVDVPALLLAFTGGSESARRLTDLIDPGGVFPLERHLFIGLKEWAL